jgi:hypothetical protein
MSASLSASNADGLFSFAMILMMISIRISLSNLALTQSRSLYKLLRQLQSATTATSESINITRTIKESISLAETLVTTIASRRYYLKSHAEDIIVEPRFLLFEFCHGVLLRNSQVDLVQKLIKKMELGQSICHQVSAFSYSCNISFIY